MTNNTGEKNLNLGSKNATTHKLKDARSLMQEHWLTAETSYSTFLSKYVGKYKAISVKDFAYDTGYDSSTIYNYLRGDTPINEKERAQRIALAIGIEWDKLLGYRLRKQKEEEKEKKHDNIPYLHMNEEEVERQLEKEFHLVFAPYAKEVTKMRKNDEDLHEYIKAYTPKKKT